MYKSNYIKIYSGNFIIVQRIISNMEKEGIIAVVKDQPNSARIAGFGGGTLPGLQEIFVHKDELETATLVIENITAELQN